MRVVAIPLAMAVVATAGVASASPAARLVYARSADASSCPDETALRGAVAARFGYDRWPNSLFLPAVESAVESIP